jgi:hypothetical protein
MTPKEKANELVEKFASMNNDSHTNEYEIKSSLIVVDEILNMLIGDNVTVEYWNEVRQEIEKI